MANGVFSIINLLSATINPQEIVGKGLTLRTQVFGWHPPQWGFGLKPAITSITAVATDAKKSSTVYVFDAVLRAEHTQELRKTENPIQSGANLTDHAYIAPARVTLDIGMSDAMASYSYGLWTGNNSKSVAAYQTLVTLQQSRALLTLTTRLRTYTNVLIDNIQTSDTNRTRNGLRATVTFCQIFLASVSSVSDNASGLVTGSDTAAPPLSARPQATGATQLGTVQALPPTSALDSQHNIGSALSLPSATTPGAGSYSSNNLGALSVFSG